MIEGIDHIGIAVKSLESAIPKYENAFSLKCSGIETVEDQMVRVAFFPLGHARIELLEATSEQSPIRKFIEKRGEGVHHIAFKSESVESDVEIAVASGCSRIGSAVSEGAGGSSVAFLHPKTLCGVLVELSGEESEA